MLAPDLTFLDFLWCWMKIEVYIINIDIPDEFLARILDTAGPIRKSEDLLRRTTRDLRTRVTNFAEVDGGIFEYLL
jgi:hypothetical protein